MASDDPRRAALIASLQLRYAAAQAEDNAAAKQALFKEAVYLNISPDLLFKPLGPEGPLKADPA
jgi:hypothetical protein